MTRESTPRNPQSGGGVPVPDRYRVVVTWDTGRCWTGHVEPDGRQLAEVDSPRLDLIEHQTSAALIGVADRMAIALGDLDDELLTRLLPDDTIVQQLILDDHWLARRSDYNGPALTAQTP